jgi:hypothetical protein
MPENIGGTNINSLMDLMPGIAPGTKLKDVLQNPDFQYLDPNSPATPEAMYLALAYGNQLKTPAEGSPLQSSGPQGGWFPGDPRFGESAGGGSLNQYGGAPSLPMGMQGPSTNNWRLLPPGYQNPQYIARSGHILDRNFINPAVYLASRGGTPSGPFGLGGPGRGYPVSAGSASQRGYFFPGQIEPWAYEGGPGTT